MIPGAKPRAILTMLGLHGGSVVSADTLVELLWGDNPPRTADKALQTHISSLRRTLGEGVVVTEGAGWALRGAEIDASRYKLAAKRGRDGAATDTSRAVAGFEEALTLWRGFPELPDTRRGLSEKTRWIEGHAALVEDRADALLATGRAAEIIGELEAAVADAPLRERRWGQLMLALYRAGRQGEALGAYQRARALLADELGVDPGPDLRRLETAIVTQDAALDMPVAQEVPAVTRAVTFLLTDIEGSTAAWEAQADAMAVALARHDELVEHVVTSRGGRLIKTRGEGDATFSVFERPSAAAAAAIELQDAITHEPWALQKAIRIRIALHTGEAELRDGDYFGRAVNRAARLRSLAEGAQILCSGATAELVIDSLSDDVVLADLGMRQLKNLARPEHVFELQLMAEEGVQEAEAEPPIERPALPAVLTGAGPFVGRGQELQTLLSAWQTALVGGTRAALIAGEPGVGKTRLAGEWSRQAYEQGAVVLYGRCDEDLGAPYQPFAEALRALVPSLGATRLRGLRGVEALLALVPGLTDVMPDLAAPTRADPDTERYALFDAVVALLEVASSSAPVVLVLDDLHWAAKPTLLLLRHLLRFGEHARVQIVGTYRSTDLDRSHPLAAMLADLHRDGTAIRISLGGLDEDDVTAYVAEAGYDDEELGRALASVTGGNPFFLIEALRHVDESGGRWDESTLPQGVREAVSRRLTRLPAETNKALAAAAVVGSRFAVELVERVVGEELVDAFDEACKAGIVIEEPGGYYRFNHAIVRQSLLTELPSVRRMRLHQRIAATLETEPGVDDELLAELAYHYFECAWAGNAAKAVEYCRRAADQAMARLGYEGAADLYDRALHALEELDEEIPDRDDQAAELLIARCEALLAAGDVVTAEGAVSQLQAATVASPRLAAWAACFDGQLSMLSHPERLDEVEAAVRGAAEKLAGFDDAAGEANAHTVRAGCLARLGRVGDCEIALDQALTAARRARDHRRVNAVLAGAPLAALWGPNPVPRAGGRCLDVVRLLRITTDSPAVEATSTRCQAVLEAFRGRAAAARRMIDSARRTVTELGLRHALLEVEQFAGIVELVVDDTAAAEPHLRKAYNGFRRMGLDADTAETAALLARACLALGRDNEADELCTESERLAGHALKAAIAWRTVRAQLLAHEGDHGQARRVAEEAVSLAERTDGLVDHGDACLALATVLNAAGDRAGAQAAAERAAGLYEQKGAAALVDKARGILGAEQPTVSEPAQAPPIELDNACVRAIRQFDAAATGRAWGDFGQVLAPAVSIESRRKIVGFPRRLFESSDLTAQSQRYSEEGMVIRRRVVLAVRGERIALTQLELGTQGDRPGAPEDELLHVINLDENGKIAQQVWFDLDDMDAAVAELDAAHARIQEERTHARLENAATRADDRCFALFAKRLWNELEAQFADDMRVEDRRHGLRRTSTDRAAHMTNGRAIASVGDVNITAVPIALRGDRLCLSYVRFEVPDPTDAFNVKTLQVTEVDTSGVMVGQVILDVENVEAAIAELDARYLAGEAADYSHTWSLVMSGYAALNRHELPAVTSDWVNIDHRPLLAVEPGKLGPSLRAVWDLAPQAAIHVETVHRLTDLGAVVTHAVQATSHEGFDAEWRNVCVLTFDGDKINRCEVFDDADLDAAIARFDQLSRPTPRLVNAASQVAERFLERFAAHDWGAMAQMLNNDVSNDDRRRMITAGLQIGRDWLIENYRMAADLGATQTPHTIATRGNRVVLTGSRFARGDGRPEEFGLDLLHVIEIDSGNRIAATITFDPEDIDEAFQELDARYLAGEAAAHAHTWSVVTAAYAALNRHQMPPVAPDLVSIDHRQVAAFAPGELIAYVRATWDAVPHVHPHIRAVHRLSDFGAVITHAAHGTSQEGFDAEWQYVNLLTFEGDLINHCEFFDEADLDSAIARFEELSRPTRQPENTASRVDERFAAHFAARDWDAMAELMAGTIAVDDRRHVVNAGLRHGRDAEMANMRARADVGATTITSTVIATRGDRLALTRSRFSKGDQGPDEFHNDALCIIEIDSDERIVARVGFDMHDPGAAFEELETRYVAGEAAQYAQTWSAITRAYAGFNRGELPATTQDWVNVDHRRAASMAPGEAKAYFDASWELAADLNVYIEDVHQLGDLGAVFTHVGKGISRDGFEAEWRTVDIMTVEGELVNRAELFDERDLDNAIARFDQLSHPAPHPENAASQVFVRYMTRFAARDWDTMAKTLADDFVTDDRRRVVNAGLRHGRDPEIANMQSYAEIGILNLASAVVATRGERLFLGRHSVSFRDWAEPSNDVIGVVEINADNQISAHIMFDADDFDSAIEELDARYPAGEAAAFSGTWAFITQAYAGLNKHEMPSATPDWVNIDHRRGRAFAPGELIPFVRASWEVAPEASIYIETVHRLSNLGAVVTNAVNGHSQNGFDFEWREIALLTLDGDKFNRSELFDETDLGTALAQFDEISRPASRLENTASRECERFVAHFEDRDWEAGAELFADDFSYDDRRRVVGVGVLRGRDVAIENMRAWADLGVRQMRTDVTATRGERLVLARLRLSSLDQRSDAFHTEFLSIGEVNADNRIVAYVAFDADDFDAAFEELDARYLAGEAAQYAHTWSFVVETYATLNRHEIPATTPDYVSIDHRRAIAFAPGDIKIHTLSAFEQIPNIRLRIEAVHRLSDLGAVVTEALRGTSREGFEAEWREINVMTTDGGLVSRSEIYDETDLDAALTRFEELSRPTPRLENGASRLAKRFNACYAEGNWDAISEMFADDFSIDDRRRVIGAGMRYGGNTNISDLRVTANMGMTFIASTVIAIRGEHLVLMRSTLSGSNQGAEPYLTETLIVGEMSADERCVATVMFDGDDIDAAFEELDARYLAGDAAHYAHTWSIIAGSYAAINRHETPALTADWTHIDHRRETAMGASDLIAYINAGMDPDQDINTYVESVHRLHAAGSVITYAANETSREGFEAEWRGIALMMVEGDAVSRTELFDESDLDAAVAQLDELSRPTPQVENAASQVYERFLTNFARDRAAVAALLTDDVVIDDRRRVVNGGVRRGREVALTDMQAFANTIGTDSMTSAAIATRESRLALVRVTSQAFETEVLKLVELDADERIAAVVGFGLDDIDAAFAELDARFLAGEAVAQADIWSVIAQTYAALNRHELPPTTPDWVNVDHRRVTTTAAGDLIPSLRATWELMPDFAIHIDTVHKLSDVGAVFTYSARGTSQDGVYAEWRELAIVSVEGDRISHCELFDKADLEAALVRFEELQPQTRRLENAASRVGERYRKCFAVRDWDGMAEIIAANASYIDRRHVVNVGVREGRDTVIGDLKAIADIGVDKIASEVIATRGQRLVLSRTRASGPGQQSEAFYTASVDIIEIDTDERIIGGVQFDADDLDSAFDELDDRYVAGEAAPHADTWSAITGLYAGFNRHQRPATTQNFAIADHRPVVTIEPGYLDASIRALWDQTPDIKIRVETVHRLSNLGAVVSHTSHGTSQEGLDAEWRMIAVFTFEGDLVSRCEMFDEADLDAALARFEELHRQTPRPENAASRVDDRGYAYFAARDWNAINDTLSGDYVSHDRRRVVNSGSRQGRDMTLAQLRASADLGMTFTPSDVIATRGDRVVLRRIRWGGVDQRPGAFYTEVLCVVEINSDERIVARVMFEINDIDAAFEELDTRYLVGEAAAHADTWSVISEAYAAVNRRKLPRTTPDWVNIDHRHGAPFAPGDLTAYLRASWEQIPDISFCIEAVQRLSGLGAVYTQVMKGTSHEGLDAEWRLVEIMTVEGGLINRAEFFDEADIDAALARFDELQLRAPQLENGASRVAARYLAHFVSRDWDTLGELLTHDCLVEDRRRGVNAGIQHGRDAEIEEWRALADVGFTNATATVVATRGQRMVLIHAHYFAGDERPEVFQAEGLHIIGIDADERVNSAVTFDIDDIDAAFKELDARYLAGEAAAHARTWSLIVAAIAAVNRHEIPPTTPDWVNADHRRAAAFAPGDLVAYLHAGWALAPDVIDNIVAVHRLTNIGAVVAHVVHGTSQEGLDVEWREVILATFEGDLINRCELFDEADLDAALTLFDELAVQPPHLENAATQVGERFLMHFAAQEWDTLAETMSDHFSHHDRRRVVGSGVRHGQQATVADMQAIANIWLTTVKATVMAIRGERLYLMRIRFTAQDQPSDAFQSEVLVVGEANADNRLVAGVVFDLDDIDAAFEELDTRYLAGESAPHAHTWSLITRGYAGLNRQELPAAKPDWVNVDHRRGIAFAPGDTIPYVQATWDVAPDFKLSVDAVHRLTDLGAVVTWSARGTSEEGFDAVWRGINIHTVEGDLFNRLEVFDEEDLDAALARFDELNRQVQLLENAATRTRIRAVHRHNRRDFAGFIALAATDARFEDRRKGLRDERPVRPEMVRALFDATKGMALEMEPVAIRGSRLALTRDTYRDSDDVDRPITVEHLTLTEVSDDGLVCSTVLFDPDAIDAAFEELDARYLTGEAAPHAHTWSVIARAHAAINRRELSATTPDWVNIDHRRLARTELRTGDLTGYFHATWELLPDLNTYIEAVYRLTDIGAVVTNVASGTSPEGLSAEWRVVGIFTIDGNLINRCELFDEADLDSALARFDELDHQAPRLENAATRAWATATDAINRRDLNAFATADAHYEDRRKGLRHESPVRMELMSAVFEMAAGWKLETEPVAVRGDHLALTRDTYRDTTDPGRPITLEHLTLTEVERAVILFDPDDIEGAFAELTTRWIARGEVAHPDIIEAAQRLNAITARHDWDAYTAITEGAIYVNHRQLPAGGDTFADHMSSVRTMSSLIPDFRVDIAEVLAHSATGVVGDVALRGAPTDGGAIEIPLVLLVFFDGDRVTRVEAFDSDQRDEALARFEELSDRMPLENAATRAWAKAADALNRRDVDSFLAGAGAGARYEDRRKVLADKGSARPEVVHALLEMTAGWTLEITPVAIRGSRLALTRDTYRDATDASRPVTLEHLTLGEVGDDGLGRAVILFDPNDIEGAFAELTARWIASGEVAHPEVIEAQRQLVEATNRHDWEALAARCAGATYVNHRQLATEETADYLSSFQTMVWLVPDLWLELAEVISYSAVGVMNHFVAKGTSTEGLPIELPFLMLVILDGDRVTHIENFDPDQRDEALARFEELNPPTPQLENSATRTWGRLADAFNRHDVDGFLGLTTADGILEDRRKGLRALHDGSARRRAAQALFDAAPVSWRMGIQPIAIRGERLSLIRLTYRDANEADRPITVELLAVLEVSDDELAHDFVNFDSDDMNGAIAELTARWAASGADPDIS
ncbi:MAG TPA: BTAD domain-containing putative transcriptional regulator [Mycobacterium sp.]